MSSLLDLPIVDGRGELRILAPLMTIAVMYFPGSPDRVDALVTGLAADELRDLFASDEEALKVAADRHLLTDPTIWRLFGRMAEVPELMAEAEHSAALAAMAADVLVTALRVGQHMPRQCSVNTAVRIVCKERGCSRSTVLKAWGIFKSVSHLWAAALQQGDVTSENFLEILTVAEGLRRRAGKQQASGARETLLPVGSVFEIPEALGIVPANLDFPPLAPWMIKELGAI